MKQLSYILFLLPLLFASCALQPVPFTQTEVVVSLSDSDAIAAGYNGYTVKLTNIATYRSVSDTTDFDGKVHLTAEEGIYNVVVTGTKTLTTTVFKDGSSKTILHTEHFSGLKEKLEVLGNSVRDTIPLVTSWLGNGFVIKEIYYTGMETPAKGSYNQDQFVEIYNNSDSLLYADGLTIVEASHLSTNAINPYTDYPYDLIAQSLYTVPGNGKNHPVKPGGSIILASLGINHRLNNPNSPVDLSNADFEWYDAGKDVDVPEVENLIRAFCSSLTVWVIHTRGSRAMAIIQPSVPIGEFVTDHTVTVLTASGNSATRIKIPNSLILDGVELGPPTTIGSKALSTSIDISYTYCNAANTGKSVRRKVLKWENGRAILQDTNNSASDFIPNATPKPGVVE